MSKISEKGYLFIHTSIFDNNQILEALRYCAKELQKKCEFYINVVENKDGFKYGHAYAWVSSPSVYNALIGKNFDGSDRFEMVEDDNWNPPERDYDEAMKEAENSGDWSIIGDIEEAYTRPEIKRDLEPLIIPPGIKYTDEQKSSLETSDDFGFIEIYPARVTIRTEENKNNSIFSSCIPDWVTEDILFTFFERFCSDKTVHVDPRTKKKFTYPKVMIKKKVVSNKWRQSDDEVRTATITFSPLERNICNFLINVTKKIKLTNPKSKKEEMLFFSQTRSR